MSVPRPRVLVVDDEAEMRQMLADTLRPMSSSVASADCAEQAAGMLEKKKFDVVLLDVNMPGASGLDLLDLSQRWDWDATFILMSGRPAMDGVVSAMRMRAADFLMKPVRAQALRESVEKAYQSLLKARDAKKHQNRIEQALQKSSSELRSARDSMEASQLETLRSLTSALAAREHTSCSHSYRVRAYTSHLAKLVGFPDAQLIDLENAALLHDIGKIGVPDSILLKPGRLTADEMDVMKQHPAIGEQVLNKIKFLQPAAQIVRYHHEWFDGSGYPDGLAGKSIPLGARIFAFADTLDAITSMRCYRPSQGMSLVRSEVLAAMGTQFDPDIVGPFLAVTDQTWNRIGGEAEIALASDMQSSCEIRHLVSVDHGLQLTH